MPQRLKLALTADKEALAPGVSSQVALDGKFLYGAPAANLNTEAEVTLREDSDPYPQPQYKGYHFGLAQESWSAKRFPLATQGTDEQGKETLTVSLNEVPDTSRLLKAVLRVSLFEPGGRPVNRVLGFPYRVQPFAIGIKPSADSVEIGQAIQFDIVALDASGNPQAVNGLRYELYREDYEYYWYYRDSRWDYKTIIRDSQPLNGQAFNLAADQPYKVTQKALDWGSYRAEVIDPATGVASSVRFQVGWWVEPGGGDSPDRLQLRLDKPTYQAGETAHAFIKAPFAGEVLLAVASNRMWMTKSVSLPADGVTVDLPIPAEWGPGVYLTATAYRPAEGGAKRGPGRAIGVTWLGLDPQPRTLQVAFAAPSELKPRQQSTCRCR
ncbi:MAG: hypothetical protein U1F68_08175 [Gammaproteobacteria bacterium]